MFDFSLCQKPDNKLNTLRGRCEDLVNELQDLLVDLVGDLT
ncbi:hypothetical protein [Thermosporothrix hazakensis]|nr:hypothetical protein [Thermosporothrix hazakensis]